MKMAVIGGGGVRSPFLARSLVRHAQDIGITEIVFMDTSEEKLALFGTMSRMIAERMNPSLSFRLTSSDVEAVRDADFVITTIRSGGDESRVFDERTALDLGVLGQETTGAGGFAMALRSVPVLLDLCAKIRVHARPGVLVFNFTNPSGLVTQALRDAGYDFVYGICDAPSGFGKQLARLLGATEESFEMTCFGLNHLSWFRDFRVNGRDVHDDILHAEGAYRDTELRVFDPEVVALVGEHDLPNEYLYFYYYRDLAVASIIGSDQTRGETILRINLRMIDALKQLDIEQDLDKAFDIFISHYFERERLYFSIESGTAREFTAKPPTLDEFIAEPDEGGYAGVALNFIKAWVTGNPVRMVLSVPNEGALPFLADNDVVEITCRIEKGRVTPVPVSGIDDAQKNLILTIKAFERGTIDAITHRNRALALKALMFHPLIHSYELAKRLLDAYLTQYHVYVGEWR